MLRVLPPPGHPATTFVEALDRANQLRLRAGALRERSKTERAWHALLSYTHTVQEPLVVVCAYCGRIRSLAGAWITLEEYMRDYIGRSMWPMVSHGFCPECLQTNLPDELPGRSVAR